jgi:HIRAN domain
MPTITTAIVGTSFHKRARQATGNLASYEELRLKRNLANPFDSNAIEVHTTDGQMLGHVPRMEACQVAPIMDKGIAVTCKVGMVPPIIVLQWTDGEETTQQLVLENAE